MESVRGTRGSATSLLVLGRGEQPPWEPDIDDFPSFGGPPKTLLEPSYGVATRRVDRLAADPHHQNVRY
jgi:hypothetical protein